MDDEDVRPLWFGGFWALLVGGGLIALLVLHLDPIIRVEDCPNYQAAGNASAFRNSDWDLYFPLVIAGWIVLVTVEQTLPVTRRGRGSLMNAVRAVTAVGLSFAACCFGAVPLDLVCH